jgi:hypothetical protein
MVTKTNLNCILKLFLLFNLPFVSAKGQNPLTYRDVFDFDINDEFQSRDYSRPPNANRIKITSQHFSVNNDSVYYSFHYSNYSSVPDMTTNPPHLVYSYSVGNDYVFYTNLDSAINFQNSFVPDSCNFFHDTLYYSPQHCGFEAYEYNSCVACCFEGQHYNMIYGKGLGIVLDYHNNSDPLDYINVQRELFYYKKGTTTCGMPDTTIPVSMNEEINVSRKIIVYPNPARNVLNLGNIISLSKIELFDACGRIVFRTKVNCDTTLDISELKSGFYILIAQVQEITHRYRIVVEKE